MSSPKTLKTKIISQVSTITKTKAFKDWLKDEVLPTSGNLFLAINNSFLFREHLKTNKSSKYIAFDISTKKTFDAKETYIIEGIAFNAAFKIYTVGPTYKKSTLEQSIANELSEIGEVLYTVVGEIEDVNSLSEDLSNANFKKLTLNPTLSDEIRINGDEIQIKDYSDRESIWEKINKYCEENSITIPENLPGMIDKAISALQNNAYSNLSVPARFNYNKKYLLDKISDVIAAQLLDYNTHLKNIDSDPKAMTEILRISYNFVSDVSKLLTLIINISDLKPIILWLTISNFFDLDTKFKQLPFGFSKKKPALPEYESVVKNARNKSFHQLFPFNKSLRFQLAALEKVTITIFSNHGKKDGNKMTFKDQELTELLRGFTRVNEQIVSKNFWIKNSEVIQASYELIVATSQAIKSTK